ncbi:cell division protein FtsQ [Rhodovarius crocodyli]|uniref:Cell division protein FtsQ n=1 Tax=Rhodovarius crocodyli TaxID=1979269 RepID=A0A437MEJ1_9PROT|nr:cell division protein FtsQ [Rhodovarius crocodyli]RVT96058.1 cell division protein FtsQ [Rhodovarius crocodyli]
MAWIDILRAGGRRAAVAQGLFAVAWLGFGAFQGIEALNGAPARERLAPTLNREALLAGRTAGAINHVMAHELPVDGWLRMAGGAVRYALGSGGPQVSVGCDDWLYLTEELRPWDGADAAMARRVAGIARLREALAERGILLLVTTSPDKARVHPEHLCGAPLSHQARGRHMAFLAAAEAQGLPVVDSLPVLRAARVRGDTYLRTDSHWNRAGATAVAEAIARAASPGAFRHEEGFRRIEPPAAEHAGDLLRLMSLDTAPDWLRPLADTYSATSVQAPEAEGGLLDEAPVPEVVLLGSSYSLNGDFHGALQLALGTRVANFGQAGGGVSGGAMRYFASPAWRENPPRLVIWEVLERALGQPIGAEEAAFLERPLR